MWKKLIALMLVLTFCCEYLIGIKVSAAVDNDAWKRAISIAGASYHSEYITLAKEYSAKKTTGTVTFGKSRTRGFADKFMLGLAQDKPELKYWTVDKDNVNAVIIKGDKLKAVNYDKSGGVAIYMDNNKTTVTNIDTGKSVSSSSNSYNVRNITDKFDGWVYLYTYGASDYLNCKGKYFKINHEGKSYYYEEFYDYKSKGLGFLFDSKGNPLAMVEEGKTCCFGYSTSVGDSDFNMNISVASSRKTSTKTKDYSSDKKKISSAVKNSDIREGMAICGVDYNPNYVNILKKYGSKNTKSTIKYSESRTKKLYEKMLNAQKSNNLQYKFSITSYNSLISVTIKNKKAKIGLGSSEANFYGGCSIVELYTPPTGITLIIGSKGKVTEYIPQDLDYIKNAKETIDSLSEALKMDDKTMGKVITVKQGDKTYYIEKFENNSRLFDSNGNILAGYFGNEAVCISFTTNISDSEFYEPAGYKEIKI